MSDKEILYDHQAKTEFKNFKIGDTVIVHINAQEKERLRVQTIKGIVIAKKKAGISSSFTLKGNVENENFEMIIPVNLPALKDVSVLQTGFVRRAKLYYLRNKVGRAARVRRAKK